MIFDYGNVLSQPQPIADTQAMADILDVPPAQFHELYWRFRIEYDAAALDPVNYWNTVARTASRRLGPHQISQLMEIDSRSWSHPAPAVPQWARQLRTAGLRVGLLSNMPVPVRDYIVNCPWLPEFDAETFSCDLGVCKPAPEIYRQALEKLATQASEVLFLDDRPRNVEAAEALGVHAVLFTGLSPAIREIEDRFALPAIPK